jgi:hypothetical protein
MSDLLFAVPWWLFISLIVVGCVVFWSGNNRNQNGPRMVGIGLIVIALLLKGISFFVETDKDKCERQTNELVTAVQKRDWSKFSSLLDPDVSLDTPFATIYANRDALVEGAKIQCDRQGLSNVSGKATDELQDAGGITVDLDAFCEGTGSSGMTVPSSWKLLWVRTGKEWRLHEITCLRIGQEKGPQMARDLGK